MSPVPESGIGFNRLHSTPSSICSLCARSVGGGGGGGSGGSGGPRAQEQPYEDVQDHRHHHHHHSFNHSHKPPNLPEKSGLCKSPPYPPPPSDHGDDDSTEYEPGYIHGIVGDDAQMRAARGAMAGPPPDIVFANELSSEFVTFEEGVEVLSD
ncbi:uncharacterized protein LOC143299033 [Babylonia areolata]|uniref:uncharacterized protein LOC143299033 n=1 Tax=Babylonia areolata TaxID=304850 RepID=UPI003FCF5F67